MSNTYFGAVHYNIHLDMMLDYTISRIFREMSLSELETLHHLLELERTQILQSLALAVLKILYAGYCFQEIYHFLLITMEIYYGITHVIKKFYHYIILKLKLQKIPKLYKNKRHFVDTLTRRTYCLDTAVPCGTENSHDVVQIIPDEDKFYLLTPYPTLKSPLKKFSPESIRTTTQT